MSDISISLSPAPSNYAAWLAALKSGTHNMQANLPSVGQIEHELAFDDTSIEDDA